MLSFSFNTILLLSFYSVGESPVTFLASNLISRLQSRFCFSQLSWVEL